MTRKIYINNYETENVNIATKEDELCSHPSINLSTNLEISKIGFLKLYVQEQVHVYIEMENTSSIFQGLHRLLLVSHNKRKVQKGN